MPKSKYGQIKKDAEKILAMKAAGYQKREIAEDVRARKKQPIGGTDIFLDLMLQNNVR